MREKLQPVVMQRAGHLRAACGVDVAVLDYESRTVLPDAPLHFCEGCQMAAEGRCDYQNTHLYGCFEAERWNGLYIYYCPMSLAFAATVVYQAEAPAFAMISGPVVMGSPAEVLADNGGIMGDKVLALPARTPEETTALAQTQWAVAMYLSGRCAQDAEAKGHSQAGLMNVLYEVVDEMRGGHGGRYPVEIEQQLQRMIVQGDKEGARELINQLLGHLYFAAPEDFGVIKARAQELVVLFSRASIEGGADVQQIFGQNRDLMAEIDRFDDLDDLSVFLTNIFYRFVGYVFDFGQIEHTNIVYKAINYVRENYAGKITLDDVAAHVYLSKSYLSKIFKEELGASFTDYVNTVRIDKSKALLLETALSLAEIADMVGFSDQSYYTKVFSARTGVSPGQYRKSRGKGEK